MILVDTSVWVDHFRSGNERLGQLLNSGAVLCHPFVTGHSLRAAPCTSATSFLSALSDLPLAVLPADAEG